MNKYISVFKTKRGDYSWKIKLPDRTISTLKTYKKAEQARKAAERYLKELKLIKGDLKWLKKKMKV